MARLKKTTNQSNGVSHQAAALYLNPKEIGQHKSLVTAKVEGGKAMSYNNYTDADATLRLCRALSTDEWPETPHVCVIVKHNNPCGAALAATPPVIVTATSPSCVVAAVNPPVSVSPPVFPY